MKRSNDEIVTLWVTALRSGKYKQGIGYLRKDTLAGPVFCCLGVLMDLAAKDGGAQWTPVITADISLPKVQKIHGESCLPPLVVMTWMRKKLDINPKTLAHMNDTMDLDFKQIASYIQGHRAFNGIKK